MKIYLIINNSEKNIKPIVDIYTENEKYECINQLFVDEYIELIDLDKNTKLNDNYYFISEDTIDKFYELKNKII